MSGGYAVTAQYYDPLMAAAHGEMDRRIADALAGLDTDQGPILDVGAGTGLTTALIAQALPTASIWAVEPDPAMRPALMTRVCASPDLRRQVTIIPSKLADARLPSTIAGAVISAALVHFDPEARATLWRLLADRLAATGRIVVEIQPLPEIPAEVTMTEAAVGDLTYHGTAAVCLAAPDRASWRMSYESRLGGEVIARDACVFDCWHIEAATALAEAAAAGLDGRVEASDLLILGRR